MWIQIELYNNMLEKEGTDGEEEARTAYKAAREESDHAAEAAVGEKVSSALIDRVRNCFLHLKLYKLALELILGNILYLKKKHVLIPVIGVSIYQKILKVYELLPCRENFITLIEICHQVAVSSTY
jgi:hypothetical protein